MTTLVVATISLFMFLLFLLAAALGCRGANVETTPPVTVGSVIAPPGTDTVPNSIENASSQVPGEEAWGHAPPVHVDGAQALGCTAWLLTGWARITCNGPTFFGAKPLSVTPASTTDRNAYASSALGHAQFTFPFRRGSHVGASFVFYPEVFRFEARWPRNTVDIPKRIGSFPAAPKGEIADRVLHLACSCPPRWFDPSLLGRFGCKSGPSSWAYEDEGPWLPGCVRHLLHDKEDGCQIMNECLTTEPTSGNLCAEGEVLDGPPNGINRCIAACDIEHPCPTGYHCDKTGRVPTENETPGVYGFVDGPTACQADDDLELIYLRAAATKPIGDSNGPRKAR